MLERELKRPVYFVEIYKATLERPIDGKQKPADRIDLNSLFKDDLVLADEEMNRFSLDPKLQRCPKSNPDGCFELCSDRMLRKFPGYKFDSDGHFEAKPGT